MPTEYDRRPQSITLEAVAEVAIENTLRDGFHAPTLVVEGTRDRFVTTFEQMGKTHEDRVMQFYKAGVSVAVSDIVGRVKQVFFVSEAWLSVQQATSEPVLPPSQYPKRKEVLVVSGMQRASRKTKLKTYVMVRDADTVLRELHPFHATDEDYVQTESVLLEAFLVGVDKSKYITNY
jgi:hypothetical protein